MLETAHYTNQITDEEIKNQVDTIMFEVSVEFVCVRLLNVLN